MKDLKNIVIKELDDSKIEDIVAIDVSKKTTLTKIMIIGTGTSERHIDSSIEKLRIKLKNDFDIITKKAEGKATGWTLLDLNDIFVNLFTKDVRDEYKLESLWEKEIK